MNAAQRLQMQRDNIMLSPRTSPGQRAALLSIMGAEADANNDRTEEALNRRDRSAALLDRLVAGPQVNPEMAGGGILPPQARRGGGGGGGEMPIFRSKPDDGRRIGNTREENAAIRAREDKYSPLDALYAANPDMKPMAGPMAPPKKPTNTPWSAAKEDGSAPTSYAGATGSAGSAAASATPGIMAGVGTRPSAKAVSPEPLTAWAAQDAQKDQEDRSALAASILPKRAFADGGRPPVGETVLVGEEGPELAVFDRPATIIPNHELPAVGEGAFYSKDRTREPLPIGGILPPPGMSRSGFRNFMKDRGAEILFTDAIEERRFDRQQQAMDNRYERSRKDQLSDAERSKQDAKAERDAAEREDDDRSLEVVRALGSDQALLSPADVATLERIKGAKARASALDVLLRRRAAEREAAQEEEARKRTPQVSVGEYKTPDGKPTGILYGAADGKVIAPYMKGPQAAPEVPEGTVLRSAKVGNATYGRPETPKATFKWRLPGDTTWTEEVGDPDEWELPKGATVIRRKVTAPRPNSSPAKGARTAGSGIF